MRGRIYSCGDCGAILESLKDCECKECGFSCCGKPMEPLEEKTKDEGMEKHVPVIEKTDSVIRVKIGSVPHPMEPEHHIEWIEIETDGTLERRFLKPGNRPEAEFCICSKPGEIRAREHCNVHGLWKSGK